MKNRKACYTKQLTSLGKLLCVSLLFLVVIDTTGCSGQKGEPKKQDVIKELLTEVFDPDNTEKWYDEHNTPELVIGSSDPSAWEQINGQPFTQKFVTGFSEFISPYFLRVQNSRGKYIQLFYGWNDDIYASEFSGSVVDNKNAEQLCLSLKGDARDRYWSGQRLFKVGGELEQDYYVFQTWVCEERGCLTKMRIGDKAVSYFTCT